MLRSTLSSIEYREGIVLRKVHVLVYLFSCSFRMNLILVEKSLWISITIRCTCLVWVICHRMHQVKKIQKKTIREKNRKYGLFYVRSFGCFVTYETYVITTWIEYSCGYVCLPACLPACLIYIYVDLFFVLCALITGTSADRRQSMVCVSGPM